MGTFLLIVFLIALYFLPSLIAASRHHHQTQAITVLNLLLGWTGLGWIIAAVWAHTAVVVQAPKMVVPQVVNVEPTDSGIHVKATRTTSGMEVFVIVLIVLVLLFIGFMYLHVKADTEYYDTNRTQVAPAATEVPLPEEKKVPPVDFSLPLFTGRRTLVCPIEVALDFREGHDLKAAVDAHLSMFGHQEAIDKSGCEEWREGIPVFLQEDGQKEASEAQSKGLCQMVHFGSEKLIFSCSLKN